MPIYKLDGQAPEFPPEGQYYIAETAVLIGRVRWRPINRHARRIERLVRRGSARRQ